jgi:hypothetical protein
MDVLTDSIREPDEDNPKGYYELERVKQIEHDRTWLDDARGKAVKMISALLKHLPPSHSYKIIFMLRDMSEILASQKQMLIRRGEPTGAVSDEKMAAIFQRHLAQVQDWLAQHPNVEVIHVRYDQTIREPVEQAKRINQFLGNCLDVQGMVRVVDPELYRQRR